MEKAYRQRGRVVARDSLELGERARIARVRRAGFMSSDGMADHLMGTRAATRGRKT